MTNLGVWRRYHPVHCSANKRKRDIFVSKTKRCNEETQNNNFALTWIHNAFYTSCKIWQTNKHVSYYNHFHSFHTWSLHGNDLFVGHIVYVDNFVSVSQVIEHKFLLGCPFWFCLIKVVQIHIPECLYLVSECKHYFTGCLSLPKTLLMWVLIVATSISILWVLYFGAILGQTIMWRIMSHLLKKCSPNHQLNWW